MKVYLLKDIPKVGVAGEVIKTTPGYAKNFLFPRKMAVEVKGKNTTFYDQKALKIEHRKEVLSSETSMLSEKIKVLKLTIKEKTHDGNKLYAAINPTEIVDLLAKHDIKISKSQVKFNKSIKTTGNHTVIIKLSSKLQPEFTLKVTSL